jgi:hypothetical protein
VDYRKETFRRWPLTSVFVVGLPGFEPGTS